MKEKADSYLNSLLQEEERISKVSKAGRNPQLIHVCLHMSVRRKSLIEGKKL